MGQGRPASILRFDQTDRSIGLYTRTSTPGAELALVEQFIAQMLAHPMYADRHVALFIEPLMQTGYPDLVIVDFDLAAFTTWCPARLTLQRNDVRLWMYLMSSGETSLGAMARAWRETPQRMFARFARLAQAGILQCIDLDTWYLGEVGDLLSLRRLYAFEAKTQANARVIQQAQHNSWFAAETSILVPAVRIPSLLRERMERTGIGCWTSTPKGCQEVLVAHARDLIRCYATLLYNEWIGRRLVANGTIILHRESVVVGAWEPLPRAAVRPSPYIQSSFDWT